MEQCNKCMLYSKGYNEINQNWNDTTEKQCQFCIMYEDGIPNKIVSDSKKCEYFIDKEK